MFLLRCRSRAPFLFSAHRYGVGWHILIGSAVTKDLKRVLLADVVVSVCGGITDRFVSDPDPPRALLTPLKEWADGT